MKLFLWDKGGTISYPKGKIPSEALVEASPLEIGNAENQVIFPFVKEVMEKADIEGANIAGLKTIFIPSTLHTKCTYASYQCDDMLNLKKIIDGIGYK